MTTILIVDDEPSIRKYLALVLGECGYRLLEAADGVAGLELARAERPDLIISDIIMPEMDGFEFIHRLRGDPAVAETNVVFMTAAFCEEEARPLAQACGVNQIITKPFEPDAILRTVSLALGTTAPAQVMPQTGTFDSEHLSVLTNKITQKMNELDKAERALKEHQFRLQALFEHTQDAILFIGDDARFVNVNPAACALLGYSRAELLDLSVWDVIPMPKVIDARGSWPAFQASGKTSGEYVLRRKDGTSAEVEYHAVANIEPGIHMGVLRDITQRKRAEDTLREYSERLRSLSRGLLEVQETERRRLARELHDELGQLLVTVNFQLHAVKELAGPAALPRLEECSATLQRAAEQVRDLSLELRPVLLEALGLEAALRYLAEQHCQRTGQAMQIDCRLAAPRLSAEQEIACFRIVQEALTNVARHAQATRVTVGLHRDETAVNLIIRDNGLGFDAGQAEEHTLKNKTFGLLGMKERVNLLGGGIEINSVPGLGTALHVHFPLILPS